jgi:tetratricopeptide (TPR) repeat protein
MSRILATFGFLLAVASAALSTQADTLRLSGGSVVSGVVEAETADRVTIRTSEGLVSFPRSQVLQIERASANERLRVQADLAARTGRLAQWLRAHGAQTSGPMAAEVDRILISHAESIAREFSKTPASDVILLASYLDDRPTSPPASARVLMARIHAERGQFSEATRWLEGVHQDALTAVPNLKSWAVGFLKERIRNALDANQPEFGLEYIALLASVAPESLGRVTSVPLVLARAGQLAAQGRPTEAIRVLKVDLEPMSAAIAFREAMRITSASVTESTVSEQLAVLRAFLDSFQGEQYDGETVPFLDQLARLLIAQGEFGEARRIAARLGAVDADAAAPFEHRIELERRRREIPPDDLLAIYRLARWAAERGLQEEARELLRQASADPNLRENAELQLQAMQLDIERKALDRVVSAFESRDFAQTLRLAAEFRSNYPSSSLLTRVRTMEEVSRFRLQRQERLRPQQADAAYQNAERLYYQGRYSEAIEALNRLEADFAGLPASQRADQLRMAIMGKAHDLSNATSSMTRSPVTADLSQRRAAARAAYLGEVTSLMLQISEAQATPPK